MDFRCQDAIWRSPRSSDQRQASLHEVNWRGSSTTNQEVLQTASNQGYSKCIACPLVWKAAHLNNLTCKEGIASGFMAILPAWLWLSPWQARLSPAHDAFAMLSVVRFTCFLLSRVISCNAAYYHDKLRCKALQSLQTECIDVSRVEKITGNSNTSTRKQMTWNMSAWL